MFTCTSIQGDVITDSGQCTDTQGIGERTVCDRETRETYCKTRIFCDVGGGREGEGRVLERGVLSDITNERAYSHRS